MIHVIIHTYGLVSCISIISSGLNRSSVNEIFKRESALTQLRTLSEPVLRYGYSISRAQAEAFRQ